MGMEGEKSIKGNEGACGDCGKQNLEEDFGFGRKLPQIEGKRERTSQERGELARERVNRWRHVPIIWKEFIFFISNLMFIIFSCINSLSIHLTKIVYPISPSSFFFFF